MGMENFKKSSEDPTLPPFTVDQMIDLAKDDSTQFEEIARKAGHKDATKFLALLEKSRTMKEAHNQTPRLDAYDIKRYAIPPDPALEQFYNDLEISIIKSTNAIKGHSGHSRDKAVAKIQDMYRQLYERERHTMIYERTRNGIDLVQAKAEVDAIFNTRAQKNMEQSDLPYDIREAESKAMRGIYARNPGDVDMATDILGPSLVF
ncbi:hypothetical protein HYT05_02255, partial [Candidatus Kaiserbacteria bacterium]|nr:hypothetical protein [Candidatus Kaiserbacteria bacterium]